MDFQANLVHPQNRCSKLQKQVKIAKEGRSKRKFDSGPHEQLLERTEPEPSLSCWMTLTRCHYFYNPYVGDLEGSDLKKIVSFSMLVSCTILFKMK